MPKKIEFQVVEEFFKSKNLKITGEYKDTHTGVKCTCLICGNEECCPSYNNLKKEGHVGCNICAQNIRKQTNLIKYGFEHPMKNEEVKERQRKITLNMSEEENRIKQERRKATCLKKYGTESPMQNQEVKNRLRKSNLEKYGTEVASQSEVVKQKIKNTNIEKYGVDCILKDEKYQEKIRQTCIEKYGVPNAMQNKDVQNKGKETRMERYGVEYPLQYKPFADKSAKSQNNSIEIVHWKTGEKLTCVGNYERSVVEYWNDIKENFVWQVEFTMPDSRKYIVDAYLPDKNLYIEIKGRHQQDSEEKWNWFHSVCPNSEIWFEKDLKKLGLKTRRPKEEKV